MIDRESVDVTGNRFCKGDNICHDRVHFGCVLVAIQTHFEGRKTSA